MLLASPAAAEDDVAAARAHFVDGVTRFQAGDFEGARVAFVRAEAAHHAPVTVYNIARAEERLGHPQAAVDAYERYLGEAGEAGEFTPASTLAIAQIKARSARLEITTDPPGARVSIDGVAHQAATPMALLVTIGNHHVVAEGDGWRAELDVEAVAPRPIRASLARPPGNATAPVPPADPATRPASPPPDVPAALAPRSAEPADLVYGAHFLVTPYLYLPRSRGSARETSLSSAGVTAGLGVEIGYAITERVEILARGFGTIGADGVPFAAMWAAGAALSYRVHRALWAGASVLGGRGRADPVLDPVLRFDTDLVFAPTIDVSFVALERAYGQWLISASPGLYFASAADNRAFFAPIGFGLRAF
jgi:hypothetical protein